MKKATSRALTMKAQKPTPNSLKQTNRAAIPSVARSWQWAPRQAPRQTNNQKVTAARPRLTQSRNNRVTSASKDLQLDRSASPVSDERHDTDADSHPSFYYRPNRVPHQAEFP